MPFEPRVLSPEPVTSLQAYLDTGGRVGLDRAKAADPGEALDIIAASGLRGRGGAGFPTATKWRTVMANLKDEITATVVVNAAEGEPGSFKDRAIIRANPYRVLEGALIAAETIGADEVVIATKERFTVELELLRRAARELNEAGWAEDITIDVVAGPEEYLFGEETALLEVIEGRMPFPRVAPPWRRGIDDVGGDSALAGDEELAVGDDETPVPPVLVNNVETMANLPLILANGADWFREVGTERSPGTIICTVTGDMEEHGVREYPMGTPLRDVLMGIGLRPRSGAIAAVLSGVSNPLIPSTALDTPLTYEDMRAAGSGLGTGGFIVFDSSSDPVAVAAGVSRFLSVESCGQCTPCKQDGRTITDILVRVAGSQTSEKDLQELDRRLDTVDDGARCFLATQHEIVVNSLLTAFPDALAAHASQGAPSTEITLIAEIEELPQGGLAVLDSRHREKNYDWTYGEPDSGQSPADRYNQRDHEAAAKSPDVNP
jgi:NADH:ubiquinone oxidoreductase subunit F (NADH-binding)